MEDVKKIKKDLKKINEEIQSIERQYEETLSEDIEGDKEISNKMILLLRNKKEKLQNLAKLKNTSKVDVLETKKEENIENKGKLKGFIEKIDISKLRKYRKKFAYTLAGFSIASILSFVGAKSPINRTLREKTYRYEQEYDQEQEDIDIVQIRNSNFVKPVEIEQSSYNDETYYTYYYNNDDSFQINRIAVLDGNQVLDVIKIRDDNKVNFGKIKKEYENLGININLLAGVCSFDEHGNMLSDDINWTPVDTFVDEKVLKKVKTAA